MFIRISQLGRVAQSVGHLTHKSEVLGSIPGLAHIHSFLLLLIQEGQLSDTEKYVHKVLVNPLGGLSLPRKSVFSLNDRPDMTLDVYHGRKTKTQQQQQTSQHKYFRLFTTWDSEISWPCISLVDVDMSQH